MSQLGDKAISLRNVTKRFGDFVAVDDLSLDIEEGEFFSLLGPSGCGKTTTLRMIAGFEFPDHGTISLHGDDITSTPPNKRSTNMVFQAYELFPHMSVFDNVAYGLKLGKVPHPEIHERVRAMLEIVGVGGMEDRGADQLSGGQQQRVALARALVNRPEVLLLDEPLSALDLKLRKKMQTELKSIQARLGTTFVYVTHDQEEALIMSDRIAVMDKGKLLQVATPRDIYERPANLFVADFVGTLNRFVFRVDRLEGTVSVMDLGDGGLARVSAARMPAVGDSLSVAVRPERVQINSDCASNETQLAGVIVEVIFVGPIIRYVVETSVGRVVAQSASESGMGALAGGSKVAVSWKLDAVLVLDGADA